MTPLTHARRDEQPRPLRVLVADDYADAADSLATLLEMACCEVAVVYDGESVASVAAGFDPDVCSIDLRMPGCDGWAAARRLRATRCPEELLLVAMTGLQSRAAQETAREAGFDHFLVKPASFGRLYRLLAGFASRSQEAGDEPVSRQNNPRPRPDLLSC